MPRRNCSSRRHNFCISRGRDGVHFLAQSTAARTIAPARIALATTQHELLIFLIFATPSATRIIAAIIASCPASVVGGVLAGK
jgi:hypothetical protein